MTREDIVKQLNDLLEYCKSSGEEWARDAEALDVVIKALEQEPCEDAVSRNAIIQTLNNMDRYVANELILCDTNNKFPQNEVFIVDDVYEQIAEQLPSVTPKQQTCEDCISRQAAIDALRDEENHAFNSYYKGLIKAHKIIANLPPVKPVACIAKVNFSKEDMHEIVDKKVKKMVVHKTGHWISQREHCENLGVMPSGLGAYEWCSNCDCGIDVREWHRSHYNYCPNCGADMREVEE